MADQDLVRDALARGLGDLEKDLGADVLAFVGPILPGVEQTVRVGIEALAQRGQKLAVILDTPGGVVETVERMVAVLRHHYTEVIFAIPDRAMSAGTVFALSGDAILMDYFSVLGPIDPQLAKDKRLMPALAYLRQFEELVEKSKVGQLTTAELVLLQKLDLGELQEFRDARDLSIDLLKKWLVQYKFKDWKVTETQKLAVTPEMKVERAKAIAEALANPARWYSHGRGISMATLSGDEIKLRIDDFGKSPGRAALLRGYLNLIKQQMQALSFPNFVHTRDFI